MISEAGSAVRVLRHFIIAVVMLGCTSLYSKTPPIEIFLSEQYGRFGDVEFNVLGGSKTHPTPTGTFTIVAKYESFYSNKYKADMPYSMFFTKMCAIHAGSLRTLSHGCIHVDMTAAAYLFYYAEEGETKVIIHK